LPVLSLAYHPDLMPRMSDLSSLMKWGTVTHPRDLGPPSRARKPT
jgi:hypothetical protein